MIVPLARYRAGRFSAHTWPLLYGLLCGSLLLGAEIRAEAAGTSAASASPKQRKAAQGRYLEGAKLYEEGKFSEALASFQSSYDIVASPNSHLMIARSLRQKGDLAAAFDEFELVEAEAKQMSGADPKYAEAGDKAAR